MRIKQPLSRVIALCAITSMLAACGGGASGSRGILPNDPVGTDKAPKSNALFKVTLPSQSASSSSKRPAYLTSQGASSLVVSVTPADPAEAALWATTYGASGFTVCYPIFSATGVTVTSNPAVIVAVGPPVTVTFPFPSPPGQDTFVITQYAGTCASSYAPPAPPAGVTAAQLIISQSPAVVVNLQVGVVNNFNTQLFECTTAGVNPPAGGTCTVPYVGPPGSITPTLGASVSFVYLGGSNATLPFTLPAPIPTPIAEPMREQGVFTAVVANRVGFPIPVVGLDGNGNVVPFTAGAGPGLPPSSGLLPHGANNAACVPSGSVTCADSISITHTEVDVTGANHFALELVDATTGAVMQNVEPITLTELNALDLADAKLGSAANVGHPYVLVGTFDGSSSAASTSMTVTMAATISSTAITPQVLTIKPQSSLFTAVAAGPTTGYTDSSAPYTAAADILNTTGATGVAAAGQGYWVTDGGTIHQVGGGAAYTVAGATTLTGMTLDNNLTITAGQILAVDNAAASAAPSVTPQKSGVYVFDPVAHTSKPLAIQDATTNNWITIASPQAIAFMSAGYVYVAAGNKIYVIDPTGGGAGGSFVTDSTNTYFEAEEIGSFPVSGMSNTDTGFDMIAAAGTLTFPDTGNSRIISVNTGTCVPDGASCAPSAFTSGHPFVGLSVNGTGYVATDSAGQIYTITSTGTVTSLGLSGGAVKDGVVGVIGTNPLAPIPYTTQGQTTNFFGTASVPTIPYSLSPFTVAGPVFTVAPAGIAADTSNGTFGTTAGTTKAGFGIAFIPAAAPASTALTASSYLFADGGSLRTLVP